MSPPHSKATSLPLPGSRSEISIQLSEEGRCQRSTENAGHPLLPPFGMPRPPGYCGGGPRAPEPRAECGHGAGPLPGASLGAPSCSGLHCLATATSHQCQWMPESQSHPGPVPHGTPGPPSSRGHGGLCLVADTTLCLSFSHPCLALPWGSVCSPSLWPQLASHIDPSAHPNPLPHQNNLLPAPCPPPRLLGASLAPLWTLWEPVVGLSPIPRWGLPLPPFPGPSDRGVAVPVCPPPQLVSPFTQGKPH